MVIERRLWFGEPVITVKLNLLIETGSPTADKRHAREYARHVCTCTGMHEQKATSTPKRH